MTTDRREFLKGTAWMGLAAAAAGCISKDLKLTPTCGAPMQGYHDKPMEEIRVGFVGLGRRGPKSCRRLTLLPGVRITAICDYIPSRTAAINDWRVKSGFPKVPEYNGPEGYKRMCERDDVDVVYSVASWRSHPAINIYAMQCGKHVFTEMPAALTIEDCWRQVEACEKYRRHCMLLENCCYGEPEMLVLNMIRKGLFGELVHGEAGYIHDQRGLDHLMPADNPAKGRVVGCKEVPAVGIPPSLQDFYMKYHGNFYPTHGLGPIARCMNINRGDAFDYLVSMESKSACLQAYGKGKFPGGWQSKVDIVKGDMNQSLIRTKNGRSILLQHDVFSPRPYSRLLVLSGTHGEFRGYPSLQMTYEKEFGDGSTHDFFTPEKTAQIKEEYGHPAWKAARKVVEKIGGHGGIDAMMDLRWTYCLHKGLPLDMDVYELASWSCLVEVTRKSVEQHSAAIDIPDFTRGAWKTAPAFAPETFEGVTFDPDAIRAELLGEQDRV